MLHIAIALLLVTTDRALEGTLMQVSDKPAQLTINIDRQFQTFPVAKRASIERNSERIRFADLTPGEFVRISRDAHGRIKSVRATARLERATVRSVEGSNVVLENGTTLTIGPVLRFVDAKGKASATATVHPGDTVILFHHPQTGNVYRFAAARPRAQKN